MLHVWAQDCMTRIFPNQNAPEHLMKEMCLRVAHNEVECFQIGVSGPPEALNDLHVEASDLVSTSGEAIAKDDIDVLYAEDVPVHWHAEGNPPEDLEGQAPGFYPDPLLPAVWRKQPRLQYSKTIGVWIRVKIGEAVPAGNYRGTFDVICQAGQESIQVDVEVWPFSLPRRSHLLMTNWFVLAPVLRLHKLEPFTDHFWQVIENYARDMSEHRQNVILTPLFSLDTMYPALGGELREQLVDIVKSEPGKYSFDFHNFDRWVQLFFAYNFEAIEGSHLASRSRYPADILLRKPGSDRAERHSFPSTMDSDYRVLLRQFLVALERHLRENGWLERFYLHVSDEPYGDQFEAYTSLANFVKGVAPEISRMDAMGAAEYAPYSDHPVPLEDRYEKFVESSGIPKEQIWFYYCCSPRGAWPNRFIDYPLIRTRIFTWAAFRYGIPGFLHWGLNYWMTDCSPYDNITSGIMPAGDSYVLYPPRPPSDPDAPVDSIRWEIIRKAMEDYEYLYMLRELSCAGDEKARKLLEEMETQIMPSFTEHTRDYRYLEDFRLRAGRIIAGS